MSYSKDPIKKMCEKAFSLDEKDRVRDKEDIRRIIETTLSGNIGGVPMPMGFRKDDPSLGGRNRFRNKMKRFAIADLLRK